MASSVASAASTTTAVAKLPKVPPSNFAALLRRSKFASYDPQIGQVYATYDGSAYRGDWGLKRPLPIRRRDGRIIIRSVDTLYQQTDWSSAYSDSMAVRKFEELRFTPQIDKPWAGRFKPDNADLSDEGSSVQQHKWMHDSDYAKPNPKDIELDLEHNPPIPDPTSMSPKRLERYLRRLRRLRPEFEQFTERQLRSMLEQNKNATSLASMMFNRYHEDFLGEKFVKACWSDPSFIYPMPHPTGGLTYNNMNDLQSAVQAKPVRGHRTDVEKPRTTSKPGHVTVVVGSWAAEEPVTFRKNEKGEYITERPVPVVDIGTKDGEPRKDLEEGSGQFRPVQHKSVLLNPPNVVGKEPERLSEAGMSIKVVRWSGAEAEKARKNPHKLGTRAYIGHEERKHTAKSQTTTPIVYKERKKSSFTAYSYTQQQQVRPAIDKGNPASLLQTLKSRIISSKGDTSVGQGKKND